QGETGGEGCVVGVVGEPVWLPCFYSGHQLVTLNFSVEWRMAAGGGGEGGQEHHQHTTTTTTITNTTTTSSDVTTTCRMSEDALENGDFSLELSALLPLRKAPQTFSMFLLGASGDPEASFTPPSVERLDPPEVNHTTFLCHSVGGQPQPTVHWLINGSLAPPEDSVTTSTLPVVNSTLYRITSHLLANVSHQTNVTCYVENLSLNETLTATSFALSVCLSICAGLCVAVAALVVGAVVYQVLLDRSYKTQGKTHRAGATRRRRVPERDGRLSIQTGRKAERPNETEG
ncbi:hypothetical protein CRUP_015628, partial [Coryphaenoides rupestris]